MPTPSNGIYPAPALTVSPCGLLSVADVWDSTRDSNEEWIRGFAQEYDSHPTINLLSEYYNSVTGGVVSDGSAVPRFITANSFVIDASDTESGLDNNYADNEARIIRELRASTQKAIEKEFWDGVVAQADASEAPARQWLTKTSGADVPRTGGLSPISALSAMELAIGNSPTGGNGVIHMTRDVATLLLSTGILRQQGPDGDSSFTTPLGTPVAIGSGYSGAGPTGATGAAATATNKWMFATGAVIVHISDPLSATPSDAYGFDPATNTRTQRADRFATVLFDPSIYSAAQVTLS